MKNAAFLRLEAQVRYQPAVHREQYKDVEQNRRTVRFAARSAMSHVARHAEVIAGHRAAMELADGIPTCMRPTNADAGDSCTCSQQYGANAQ